jgi:hypothetical protein
VCARPPRSRRRKVVADGGPARTVRPHPLRGEQDVGAAAAHGRSDEPALGVALIPSMACCEGVGDNGGESRARPDAAASGSRGHAHGADAKCAGRRTASGRIPIPLGRPMGGSTQLKGGRRRTQNFQLEPPASDRRCAMPATVVTAARRLWQARHRIFHCLGASPARRHSASSRGRRGDRASAQPMGSGLPARRPRRHGRSRPRHSTARAHNPARAARRSPSGAQSCSPRPGTSTRGGLVRPASGKPAP